MATKTVAEAMHRTAQTVKPDDTIKHAAALMEACEIGPLPVCDGERLVGMITDRDITVRAVAAGRDPNTTAVRDVMSGDAIAYCTEDQNVEEAVAMMQDREVRRLPVLDRNKRLVGMLALADVARKASSNTAAEAVRGVSKPTGREGVVR